jgi:predicted LPLAT superfamily acyltransferase
VNGLSISLDGHEHVVNARGALVLGAHLGSFEALQALSVQYDLKLNVVVDLRNARQFAAVMAELAPDSRVRFISVNDDDPTSVLPLTRAIEEGELVAMLADRLTSRTERSVAVPFLGGVARFPTGPFVMAHALGCPVLFACALYEEPNRYRLVCEPFAEKVVLPRATRAQALDATCRRYASTLDRFTRQAPDNWFNFFPFWDPP